MLFLFMAVTGVIYSGVATPTEASGLGAFGAFLIVLWERKFTRAAMAKALLHAAHALGFAGGWLTAWPAFSDHVRDAFGTAPDRME